METFSAIASIVLSVISVGIAVVAIIQTNRQIKLSNKQQLFDRRVKCYMFFKQLIFLFEDTSELFSEEFLLKEPDLFVYSLTNDAQLEDMANITKDIRNIEYKRVFLNKCEMFESMATEMELIWSKDEISQVAQFVRQYKDLLKELNKQNYIIKTLDEKNAKEVMTLEAYNKKSNNQKLINLFEETAEQYKKICEINIVPELSNSIRL